MQLLFTVIATMFFIMPSFSQVNKKCECVPVTVDFLLSVYQKPDGNKFNYLQENCFIPRGNISVKAKELQFYKCVLSRDKRTFRYGIFFNFSDNYLTSYIRFSTSDKNNYKTIKRAIRRNGTYKNKAGVYRYYLYSGVLVGLNAIGWGSQPYKIDIRSELPQKIVD